MNVSLEFKKIKRTGFFPAFFAGGVLAGAIPLLDMVFRSESYADLKESPLQIIFGADWQMMAMLNVLLIVAGACLMYHTEYADNAIQKMKSLPMKESGMFFGKSILLTIMLVIVLAIEAVALTVTSFHWFGLYDGFWIELGKNLGYLLLLSLPSILLSLIISSVCKNMWVSLGIGVVCVFVATMLPTANSILAIFPFAMPFQVIEGTSQTQTTHFIMAAAQIVLFSALELFIIKVRRSIE